jgi:phosphodiester glycosidase
MHLVASAFLTTGALAKVVRRRRPTCRRLAMPAVLLLSAALLSAQPRFIGPAERIGDGVLLYRLDDQNMLDPPGHVAVQALQLEPRSVRLESGIAADHLPARETVQSIARRRGALAAVNAGFFALADGAPQALLKTAGTLVGRAARPKGAVGLLDRRHGPRLLFDRVTTEETSPGTPGYRTRLGSSPKDWARARNAVSGAGLLVLDGRDITDWTEEALSAAFDTTRHPRTMIGVDANEAVWLVTVDGRQPALSLGMTFKELQALSHRLGLRSALNLDGGGSTTMVVRGYIVNHPSDDTGPRKVSDAILVFPRKGAQ